MKFLSLAFLLSISSVIISSDKQSSEEKDRTKNYRELQYARMGCISQCRRDNKADDNDDFDRCFNSPLIVAPLCLVRNVGIHHYCYVKCAIKSSEEKKD